MIRNSLAAVTVLLMALALMGTPANAAAPLEVLTCTGTETGTYFGSGTKPETFDYAAVRVPKGKSCTLKNVAVKHNVKSLHGSHDVKVLDSYVGNNVHVENATGTVHVGQAECGFDPAVRANVLVYDSHNVLVCEVTGHNIQVKRNDGRITVRDNASHRIDVSRNRAFVSTERAHHRKPGAVRVLRNTAKRHVHVFRNHKTRPLVLRGNTPGQVVK